MSSGVIIEEIKQLSAEELTACARKLIEAAGPGNTDRLKAEICQGFYGIPANPKNKAETQNQGA